MKLKGKIVVLTGVTGGLGTAVASALIKKGATVYGIGRNELKLNQLSERLGASFKKVQCDISNKKEVANWVKTTFSSTNSPAVLINNAGVGSFHKIEETTSEVWEEMVNTNLNGMYYITSLLTPFMKNNTDSSHIINIGSILGKVGRADSAAYCTTKFGVQGFSQSLNLELRFFNIKVTCINPGSIETDFFETSGIKAHANMLQPKELAKTILHVLETADNLLIDEITLRPLNPKTPIKNH
ncbi:MAG: SDR family oxidoreductase [Crocinitomicaceae bacterium]|nr:SDR family oxidoreductase [Crocinitomicaceae bacterium]